MAVLRNLAIDWYRKVFGAPAGSDIREQGLDTVLDGNSAVALSEAGIATHAVLGGRSPAGQADAVWLGEVEHGNNLFGQALAAQTADGPRGIVAAATGLALAVPAFLVIALTGGGPGFATDLPATYMYAMAFSRGDIGQAASSAMIMMGVVFTIVVPYLYSELRAKND